MDDNWKDAPPPKLSAVMADLIAAQTEVEILRDRERKLREIAEELINRLGAFSALLSFTEDDAEAILRARALLKEEG